ncbi:MAG TPA: Vms1/Ankzf1 family peptidyl-tRNA hydrolase [Jatrophihabitantaceae bacterium]|jgi:hypothetical protein
MVELSAHTALTALYRHQSPFTTIYLDATRATESGRHEVELRWRALRRLLTEQGAGEADIAALEIFVSADHEVGNAGLVVVAAQGSVAFSDRLPGAPLREIATSAPLPHLMPYLAQRGPHVPYLVVLADREGADIAAAPWLGEPTTSVDGGDFPVHKTGRNTWDEVHFQQRVENAWAANAREVADAVVTLAAKHGIELVVIAGDERARGLLQDQLSSGLRAGTAVVSIEHGSRAPGASERALEAAVHDAVLHHVWRARRATLEHLQQNLGRQEYAVAGVEAVVNALRMAAVDTLVISDDPTSTLHAYVGPDAVHVGGNEEELRGLGVAEPQRDRLDSALVRAAVGTGADIVVTPNAHEYVADGVGALLRYDQRA